MARINGVDLPREKRVEIGLTYIYGIGRTAASKICAETGVDPSTHVRDLTEDEVAKMRDYIDANFTVEGDLRREQRQNIARLMEIARISLSVRLTSRAPSTTRSSRSPTPRAT